MGSEQSTFTYFYWSSGSWINETIFSIYSFCRFLRLPARNVSISVFTTNPEPIQDLPVTVRLVDPEELKEWIGPHENPFRARFPILRELLSTGRGPVILMDGDTYFRRSPELLIRRVRPGHSAMHICEGKVARLNDEGHRALHAMLQASRGTGDILARIRRPEMWNSGVVGIHPADAGVLEDIVALHDAVMARDRIFAADQFAFGMALRERTILHECYDLVFHYWHRRLRDPFRETLNSLVPQLAALPFEQRPGAAYPHRPRLGPYQKARALVWYEAKRLEMFGKRGAYPRRSL